MGVLRDHPLQPFIDQGYTVLAETGTGTGTAVEYARSYPALRAIYSCDIDKDQVRSLSARWAHDARVRLFPMASDLYLQALLAGRAESRPVLGAEDRVIWFLDSHYPGFDLGKAAIDSEKDLDVRLPLHTELRLLRQYKRDHDVVIADDLRIFEPNAYQGGTMEQAGYGYAAAYDRPLDLTAWEQTHTIHRDLRDTGYLILRPKSLAAR